MSYLPVLWAQDRYSVRRRRHRRLTSPLEPLDRQRRDGCSRETPTTGPDTGATAIATATAIPMATALPLALGLATATLAEATATLAEVTATLAEVTGTRPILPYMGVAHIGRIVPIGALIAAHTGDGASFANVSLQSFE